MARNNITNMFTVPDNMNRLEFFNSIDMTELSRNNRTLLKQRIYYEQHKEATKTPERKEYRRKYYADKRKAAKGPNITPICKRKDYFRSYYLRNQADYCRRQKERYWNNKKKLVHVYGTTVDV
jgi:hypothetical protein